MLKRLWRGRLPLALAAVVVALLTGPGTALACGGLFCQNSPVDQNAERIIFTQNGDGTVSAIVQIQYTGWAEEFSWVLPLPNPIGQEDIEVPETAMNAFFELETQTNPVFIPPPPPECAMRAMEDMVMEAEAPAEEEGAVTVFASGEVGPYGFDVIGSEDPDALIIWLRDHEYRVTEEMEPLINVYVDEGASFLAMRLLPESDVQDIQPVKVTYETDRPMIPLRLTAVAANPDMAVIVWFYANNQAVPENYAHMEIADEELTFFTFGGNNYRQLMGERADEFGGQAFITEYAQPTRELPVADPLLVDLHSRFAYLTRLNTVISPEEMTVDPMFDYNPQLRDVSNIHDLSSMTGLYDCEREGGGGGISLPIIGEVGGQGSGGSGGSGGTGGGPVDQPDVPTQPESPSGVVAPRGGLLIGVVLGGAVVLLLVGFVGLVALVVRQSRK